MKRILLAGATGYLGSYIAKELQKRNYHVRVIARDLEKLKQKRVEADEILEANITRPESIKNCCKKIDVAISTVGITRQKDGLTYYRQSHRKTITSGKFNYGENDGSCLFTVRV
ncbi:MAG: NAD(P)H-binding protein [Desulfobacterales bacterium]|jgi:uncharacterized protein YbjT (DUF2867 family)